MIVLLGPGAKAAVENFCCAVSYERGTPAVLGSRNSPYGEFPLPGTKATAEAATVNADDAAARDLHRGNSPVRKGPPPEDPRHGPTIGSQEGAFSYERGTPVERTI